MLQRKTAATTRNRSRPISPHATLKKGDWTTAICQPVGAMASLSGSNYPRATDSPPAAAELFCDDCRLVIFFSNTSLHLHDDGQTAHQIACFGQLGHAGAVGLQVTCGSFPLRCLRCWWEMGCASTSLLPIIDAANRSHRSFSDWPTCAFVQDQ